MSKRQAKRTRRRRLVPRQGGWTRKAFFRPWGELLEPRRLLDASSIGGYDEVSSAWFEQVPATAQTPIAPFVGPIAVTLGSGGGDWQSEADVAQWIVRLTPTATQQAGSVSGVASLIARNGVPFQVVRGLGLAAQGT